ncbi:MAG: hypothetical protein JZU55_10705 [Afipia sp.]|nr:hypothetical protein [Afipia sp.]
MTDIELARSLGSSRLSTDVYKALCRRQRRDQQIAFTCNKSSFCNKCTMVGRPKRALDAQLAAELCARRIDAKISNAVMARHLGVATTTLTRSLKENSFSEDLGERVRAMLADPAAFELRKTLPEAVGDERALSVKDVQVLQKFAGLLPLAEAIIKNLVERTGAKE